MKKLIQFLIVSLLLSACGRFDNEDKKQEHEQRIVCISKQYSEIIYALGAEKDIVAVDVSSTYPPAIKDLPTVGYHRALSAEGILSTEPTLIIHDNNIGPEHVVTQLERLHIPMKTFGDYSPDIEGTKSLIREMGKYFHKESRADSLCEKLDQDMALALEQAKEYDDTVRVVIIHFGRAMNIYLAVTNKSTAGQMIEWAGGKIVIDDEKGMKQLTSPEIIAKADPDVILLTDFGYDRLGSVEKIKELPGVGSTKAALNHRIYRVEEHDLIYLGPRTGQNVLELQKLIHQHE